MGALGPVLEASWACLGRLLGRSGSPLGCGGLEGLLGALGRVLGVLGGVLETIFGVLDVMLDQDEPRSDQEAHNAKKYWKTSNFWEVMSCKDANSPMLVMLPSILLILVTFFPKHVISRKIDL